ncbi:MAG: adenylyltransferase/cytidyltransferase family protein [Candidatus Micrarchaeota archaeon]
MQIGMLKKLCILQIQEGGISEGHFMQLSPQSREFLIKKGEKYFIKPEFRKLIIIAMTGGVFDIIHPGHVLALTEAKKHGDMLIVAIATDETVKKIKQREPMHAQKERVEMVNALKPVDLAIPGGKDWRQTLAQVSPDIVIFGYDQQQKEIAGIKTIKLDAFAKHENSKTGKVREKLGF